MIYSEILLGMEISEVNIKKNLDIYGPFALLEPIMMDLSKKGKNRQTLHEEFRKISLQAWDEIELGNSNPLFTLISKNKYLSELDLDLKNLFNYSNYVGTAPERSLLLQRNLNSILKKYKTKSKSSSKSTY